MAFKLTEEQKQQIQAGFDRLPPYIGGERSGHYDSWAGIELQLAEAKLKQERMVPGSKTSSL